MLRERAGRQEWTCDVPSGASAGDVWRAVVAAHPALAEFASAVSCAINADFAPMTAPVHEGDDVAFLPPVSGGAE
jgi:molybdopterin converting factor small subunit